MHGEILAGVYNRLPIARATGAWTFLRPSARLRELGVAQSDLIDALAQDFSAEDLESARVLMRQTNGALSLNPVLRPEAGRALFLYKRNDPLPFDAVNQSGSLLSDDPPAFGACLDSFTRELGEKQKSILVPVSMDDLTVLRLLHLPCTTSAGLLEMNGRQIRRLFRDRAAVSSHGYRLVLVGISLSKLKNECPMALRALRKKLADAENAYGFETQGHVEIWMPTPQEFEAIASAAAFGDAALAKTVIWDSISCSTVSARECQEQAETEAPTDYAAARRDLLQTISRTRETGFHLSDLTRGLTALNRAFDQNTGDAILREAASMSNPFERSLMLMAAEIIQHWHQSSPLIRSVEVGISARRPPAEESMPPGQLRERLQLIDRLVQIHKQLAQAKKSRLK